MKQINEKIDEYEGYLRELDDEFLEYEYFDRLPRLNVENFQTNFNREKVISELMDIYANLLLDEPEVDWVESSEYKDKTIRG